MAVSQTKLSYIKGYQSGLNIELQTGISLFEQKGILSGDLIPSSKQQQSIRNMFQRTAYKNLRDAGMPYHQARRFSWYTPEKITNEIEKTGKIINTLAEYATAAKTAILDKQGEAYDVFDVYADMYDSIYEGIKTSPKPAEAWEEYVATIETGIK